MDAMFLGYSRRKKKRGRKNVHASVRQVDIVGIKKRQMLATSWQPLPMTKGHSEKQDTTKIYVVSFKHNDIPRPMNHFKSRKGKTALDIVRRDKGILELKVPWTTGCTPIHVLLMSNEVVLLKCVKKERPNRAKPTRHTASFSKMAKSEEKWVM